MNHRPEPLNADIRRRMQKQARRDTNPELALRKELHSRGLRYRLDVAPIAGMRTRADIVFRPSRVAVFVDGCFWHRCPEHGTIPTNNREWWIAKLEKNVLRDRRIDAELRAEGWIPLRVWEHEDVREAADIVERTVRRNRSAEQWHD